MILVFGATGQLGRSLARGLGGARCVALAREQADFARPDTLASVLDGLAPELVINAAAYTDVERAEREPDLARRINAEAPARIARWCASRAVPLIHLSTDFVFSGEGTAPWRESDPVSPLNAYGRGKLEGERLVLESGARAFVLRTSWVYSARGRNFLTSMLELGRTRETLRVVDDQVGAPTYAADLASLIVEMVGSDAFSAAEAGVYHLCHEGAVSRHMFAEAIFEEYRGAGLEPRLRLRRLEAIPSADLADPVRRPANSRLDLSRWRGAFRLAPPHWREGLRRCMEELRTALPAGHLRESAP